MLGAVQEWLGAAKDVPAENPYRSAIAVLGGAKPSRLRQQLANGERGQETA